MNGQSFNYALENVSHFNVLADETKVSSITLNVLSNALKYTPEGGEIDFRLREIPERKPGYASYTLTVKDAGMDAHVSKPINVRELFGVLAKSM